MIVFMHLYENAFCATFVLKSIDKMTLLCYNIIKAVGLFQSGSPITFFQYKNPPKWERVSEAAAEPAFIAAVMSPSLAWEQMNAAW